MNNDLEKTKEKVINSLLKKRNKLITLLQEGLIDETTYLSKMEHVQCSLRTARLELAFLKNFTLKKHKN